MIETKELRRMPDERDMGDSEQGSITDELRVFAKRWPCTDHRRKDMLAIADRIDAEHELAIANEWTRGVEYVLSREGRDKYGLVYLQLDAGGEYVNVFDKMEYSKGTFTVNDMTLGIDGMWRALDIERGYTVLLAKCRHYHEPTVEDLLVDMHRELSEVSAAYAVDSDELESKFSHIIDEFAAKLQLRGDEQ